MHVGVITYQTGHLKTLQVVNKLLMYGHRVSVFAFPFKVRPQKPSTRYVDRPHQLLDINIEEYWLSKKIGYYPVGGWTEDYAKDLDCGGDKPSVFIHCIAKIVPKSFIEGRTILNCHPGLLPFNRGVDSFKWSIVNNWPIGVTLHVIDEEIDRGTILHCQKTPIFETDSLFDIWNRSYEIEVDLLTNFDRYIINREKNLFVGDTHPCSHKLIPLDIDGQIENLFMDRKKNFITLSLQDNDEY